MITMDMPIQLASNNIELVQQAPAATKKLPRFDYLIKQCSVVQGEKNTDLTEDELSKRSDTKTGYYAGGIEAPASVIGLALPTVTAEDELDINKTVQVLQLPKHGTLTKGVAGGNLIYDVDAFGYLPDAGFKGEDKAIFAADYKGQHYKIVINFRVRYEIWDDKEGGPSRANLCPNAYDPKRIKLNDISNEMLTPYAQVLPATSSITAPSPTCLALPLVKPRMRAQRLTSCSTLTPQAVAGLWIALPLVMMNTCRRATPMNG